MYGILKSVGIMFVIVLGEIKMNNLYGATGDIPTFAHESLHIVLFGQMINRQRGEFECKK